MIKTVKVEDLVKYARNCANLSNSDNISRETKRYYKERAETVRAFLASEDASRKYKPGAGKDEKWAEYFNKVWEEYSKMIFG